MCNCKNSPTCEKADDQAYHNDREAVKRTVPHVGQWIKPLQSRGSPEEQRETIKLWYDHNKHTHAHKHSADWAIYTSDCCLLPSEWQQSCCLTAGRLCSEAAATSCRGYGWRCSRCRPRRPGTDRRPDLPTLPGDNSTTNDDVSSLASGFQHQSCFCTIPYKQDAGKHHVWAQHNYTCLWRLLRLSRKSPPWLSHPLKCRWRTAEQLRATAVL